MVPVNCKYLGKIYRPRGLVEESCRSIEKPTQNRQARKSPDVINGYFQNIFGAVASKLRPSSLFNVLGSQAAKYRQSTLSVLLMDRGVLPVALKKYKTQ